MRARLCPDCRVERADYEGPGAHLPDCPNCGTRSRPIVNSAARRLARDRPLLASEVERAILEAIDEAEDAADELEDRAIDAARTESSYRRRRAQETITPSAAKTEAQKEARAIVNVADLMEDRDMAAALERAQAEVCRVRREAIEALRSILVGARGLPDGRG